MPVVATDADLLHLRARLHRMFLGAGDRRYEFRHPRLDQQENERLSLLTHSYMNECGCAFGSLFISLTAGASVVYYFSSGGTVDGITVRDLSLLVGLTVAGAIAGKILGLLLARIKMLRLVRHALELTRRPHHHAPAQEKTSWEESAAKPRNG